MGSCLSKKNGTRSSSSAASVSNLEPVGPKKDARSSSKNVESEMKTKKKVVQEGEAEEEVKKEKKEESTVKKEIFVIKHRKSHDKLSPPLQTPDAADGSGVMCSSPTVSIEEAGKKNNNGVMIRTSSCTKEEVDAILIQCGRLSRSNSAGRTGSASKKYSGSKRSYDFDHNDLETDLNADAPAGYGSKRGVDLSYNEDEEAGEKRQHRQRHRDSGRPSPQGRRRTPSRERDQQQQRSGSRERGTNGSRRVSRSPGRRSETTPNSTITGNTANPIANCSSNNKPGKMISVPATVSSLVMDKSNNGGGGVEATASIKRISVKRNVGEPAGNGGQGSRNAASPRSRSPARTTANATHTRPQSPARTNGNGKGSNENQQQPVLSRNSSRNKEQSPYRRNPLSEIDPNTLAYPQSAAIRASCTNNSRLHSKNKEVDVQGMQKESTNVHNQKLNPETSKTIVGSSNNKAGREQQITFTTVGVVSEAEGPKPQLLTRSMSSRRSRDFDINPEVLLNPPAPPSSYTSLLLEDINKFHQKATPSSFSLPQCLNKACSILEAVADLNSTTSSNLSSFSEDKRNAMVTDANLMRKKQTESEVLIRDDLMEPSFHKYVTVRRGGSAVDNEDMEEQESSGSNSYVGNGQQQQQHWGLSSNSWEPSSADSTGRWTSNSNTREIDQNTQAALTEPFGQDVIETKRGKKKEYDHLQGSGRARVGVGKGLLHNTTIPVVTVAATS